MNTGLAQYGKSLACETTSCHTSKFWTYTYPDIGSGLYSAKIDVRAAGLLCVTVWKVRPYRIKVIDVMTEVVTSTLRYTCTYVKLERLHFDVTGRKTSATPSVIFRFIHRKAWQESSK